jgi:hypothetical protein
MSNKPILKTPVPQTFKSSSTFHTKLPQTVIKYLIPNSSFLKNLQTLYNRVLISREFFI